MTGGVFQYSRWDQAGRVQDGVCETMTTGRVICVLSREMVGSSTSAAQGLLPRNMDALSREKIQERSARFGAGSRQERVVNFLRKIER